MKAEMTVSKYIKCKYLGHMLGTCLKPSTSFLLLVISNWKFVSLKGKNSITVTEQTK